LRVTVVCVPAGALLVTQIEVVPPFSETEPWSTFVG